MAGAGGEGLSADCHQEILLRSRAADCLNWRRVCKEWRRMITCRFFVCAHRRRRPPRPLPLVLFRDDDTPSVPQAGALFRRAFLVGDISSEAAVRADGRSFLLRDISYQADSRAFLFGDISSEAAVRADGRAFLLRDISYQADGSDARAHVLLWYLSSADAHAEGGVPLIPFGRADAPLLLGVRAEAAHVGAQSPPPLSSRGSPFDSLLQSLSDETGGRLVALRVDAIDVRGRFTVPLIRFRGDDAAFSIHGCLGDMLLVSYHGSLFMYSPCNGTYTTLPPIHTDGVIIGFYAHPVAM